MIPVEPQYWYWEKELSDETCDHIISLAQKYELEDGVVGGNEEEPGILAKDKRDSGVRWITDNFLNNAIFGFALKANDSSWGLSVNTRSNLQFTEYTVDQYYGWHMDTFMLEDGMRKISIVVQLTDPSNYEGGDFQFRNYGGGVETMKVLRQRGTVLIFPSWIEHRVTPVTKGKRQTLVAWMSGPALV